MAAIHNARPHPQAALIQVVLLPLTRRDLTANHVVGFALSETVQIKR